MQRFDAVVHIPRTPQAEACSGLWQGNDQLQKRAHPRSFLRVHKEII